MPPHSLTNFEIQKYYQNEPRFKRTYSTDNLPRSTQYEYSDIGTHSIVLYVLNNNLTYFDSFGAEHIPQEIKAFIGNKNVKTNSFGIQAYDSIMCGYFCIGFIDFILARKTLTDFTNLFPPNNF